MEQGLKIRWQPEARRWFDGLSRDDVERLAPALDAVSTHGKSASKRFVKPIKSSRHPEMHEIRSAGGNLRILFAFEQDHRKTTDAYMLVGGDKTGIWNDWYPPNVRQADGLYDKRKRNSGRETPCGMTTAGSRSAGHAR